MKNGLHIKNFEGDENDDEFNELKQDLIGMDLISYIFLDLVVNKVPDVRMALDPIRQKMKQRYELENNPSNQLKEKSIEL
jgi:hypothetical protein